MRSRDAAWLAALAATLSLAGCGGDASDPKPAERAATVTEYVGKTEDRTFFVALALDRGGAAKGYVCDGRGHAAAFDGKVRDGRLEIDSKDGTARLDAEVDAQPVVGSVEFRGQRRSFRLPAARGIGGLYTFRYSAADAFSARSERGNEIDGHHEVDRISAIVTTIDDESRPLDAQLGRGPASQRGYRAYRVILLDDGDFRGNSISGSALLAPGAIRNRPIISPA